MPVQRIFNKTKSIASVLDASFDFWRSQKAATKDGPRVLVATTVAGFHHVSLLESSLAAALTLRGAAVDFFFCDAALPGCLKVERDSVPDPATIVGYRLEKTLCKNCMKLGRTHFDALDLPTHYLSALITAEEKARSRDLAAQVPCESIPAYQFENLAIGEHAHAGALRYYARGEMPDDPVAEQVLRRYFEAALLTVFAVRRLISRRNYSVALFHHGIYTPQGIIGEVCREAGIRVVNWNPAYRRNTFIFSHDNSYHHTMLDEPLSAWADMPWSEGQKKTIKDYLESRREGSRDWIWFHEKPDEDFHRFARSIGLDLEKPVIGMLTNVMWDAQLHFRQNAFSNMLEWVLATIGYFAKRPDLQLMIRVHPAEIRGTALSRQPLVPEIENAFPSLPENVFVIAPESPVSTYAAMDACNAAIIYGTKTGIEVTSVGIPTIVAGEAWIRNKGLTLDATTKEQYFGFLDRLPFQKPLPSDTVDRALMYAYHFYFRRMVPLPFLIPGDQIYDLSLDDLRALQPGSFPGLDVVCDGVLNGSPFIYEAEHLGLHDA